MEFDLWQIIIHNDFRIVKVMIAKILVLHKLVPNETSSLKFNNNFGVHSHIC